MKFALSNKEVLSATQDTAVIFLHEESTLKELKLPVSVANDFKGKDGQLSLIYPDSGKPKRIMLVGLGKKEKFHLNKIRLAVSYATNYARQLDISEIAFSASYGLKEEDVITAIAESAEMAFHKFDNYKSEKINPKLSSVIICTKVKDQKPLDYALIVSKNCNAARDLINMPATLSTPAFIADKAKELSKSIKCTVYGKKELEKMNANGILAVSSGSINEPRLVVLEYSPSKTSEFHHSVNDSQGGILSVIKNRRNQRADNQIMLPVSSMAVFDKSKTVALVGKGITFDSGGLSIKPAAAMETMKTDMAGAVAVMHTVLAASELKLNVNIIGIMALTENVIGPSSYKPGDIIKTMSGKTIEILNTDAEGRVVLSDALHLASTFNPDFTIDIATLTGACIVALGQEASGVMGTDKELIELLKKSGDATYERVWELPLYDEYADLIVSDFADLKNVVSNSPSPSGAGAITAAKFLQNFAKGKWAHIDIAGTDWADLDKGYKPKGATGVGVRLLTHFLSNL